MSIFDFDFEALSIFRVLSNKAPRTIIKTITGAFPLSWQDGSGGALADYKIKGKSEKCVTIGGVEYGVDDDVTLLDSVYFNGNTYVKTPVSSYTNKGKFEIEFACSDTATRFLTGQNPDTQQDNIGIFNYASGLSCQNGANTRRTLSAASIGTARHTLVLEDGKVTIDGNETSMTSVAEFTISQDLYIGSATSPTTGAVDARCFKGDICHYFHKDANGNYDVLCYGAIKNSVVGLYDILSGTFIEPTVGTLTEGKTTKTVNAHSQIPVELYQEVSYLGLQGEEYINTGINPSSKKIGAIIDFQFTDTTQSAQGVFGSNKTDGTNNCQFTVYQSKWRTKINSFAHYGGNYNENRHTVRFNMADGTKLDDTVITNTQYTIASSNDVQLLLGACSYNGSATGYTLTGKLYPSKIYVDDALTLDYVPVKRLSDDTYGLYDLVSDTFFGNEGDGAFTGGSVNQLEVPLFHYRGVGDYCGKKNQLINKDTLPASQTKNGLTMTNNGDGTLTINGTATAVTYFESTPNSLIGRHNKFYFDANFEGGSAITFSVQATDNSAWGYTDIGGGAVYDGYYTTDNVYIVIEVKSGVTLNNITFTPQLHDLTEFFPNETITDVSTAKARINAVMGEGYHAYDNGTDYYDRHIVTATGGMADLGTLNWTFYSSDPRFYATISDSVNRAGRYIDDVFCDGYTPSGSGEDKTMFHNGKNIIIYDSRFTDAAAFKAAMSGKYLYYQRATDDSFSVNHYHVYTDAQGFSCGDVADEVSFLGGDVLNTLQMSFDGTEAWVENGGVPGLFQLRIAGSKQQNSAPYAGICSGHFTTVQKSASGLLDGECSFHGISGTEGRVSVRATAYSGNINGFLAMLRAQSENGTPLWICAERLTPVTKAISAPAITDPTGYVHFDVLTKTRTGGEVKYNSRELSVRHGDGIGTE